MPASPQATLPPQTPPPPAPSDREPVLGFVLFGGSLSGALVRDIRLANELASRGYKVHVWWAIDRPNKSPLHGDIEEHWLFAGFRYSGWGAALAGGDRRPARHAGLPREEPGPRAAEAPATAR